MTGTANIEALWARLETWGRDNAPNMPEDLLDAYVAALEAGEYRIEEGQPTKDPTD